MKYLFFDIECSNCFNGVGKMCEFGYVLADENFNIIKSGDIPMSPGRGEGNRFHLKGRKHEKDLELAYEYGYYLDQPEFPYFYSQIKKMMEDHDTICFAYSMNNDIQHLHHACTRYGLQPLNYVCYDVQKLVAGYLEINGQMSLHKACQTIVGRNSCIRLQEHLSRDDAEMERMIFESICILTKKDSKTLLEESQFARAISVERINEFKHNKKTKVSNTAGYELYNTLVVDESELDKPDNIGRRYNISSVLKNDLNTLKFVIKIIQSKNGIFSKMISKTDYFIVYDDKNKEEIVNGFKYPFTGQVLTLDEFIALIDK